MRNSREIVLAGSLFVMVAAGIGQLSAAPRIDAMRKLSDARINSSVVTSAATSVIPVVTSPRPNQTVTLPFEVRGKGKRDAEYWIGFITRDASGKDVAADLAFINIDNQGRWNTVFGTNVDHKTGKGFTYRVQVTEIWRRGHDDGYNKTRTIPVVLGEPLSSRVPSDIGKRTKGHKVIVRPGTPNAGRGRIRGESARQMQVQKSQVQKLQAQKRHLDRTYR